MKKANDESEKLKATFNDDKKKAEDEKNKLSELKSTEVELQKVKSLYEEKKRSIILKYKRLCLTVTV